MNRIQIEVPLSHLIPGKHNPRKVKPSREAHQRLVALIRSQGLLQPLVVRPADTKAKHFVVIAGNRRLAALKEIHRSDGDTKIPCVLKDVDADTADALSLGENFAREPMHPLDEAERFAKLASNKGKDAEAIASEFGVTEHYVRQRMKLATLAESIKTAYREGSIDTATAEAFAAVPEDRQMEVWKEVGGDPVRADHVRSVIANSWIDATRALFDVSSIPESAVSRDLFGDRILVERQAFMEAQKRALEVQQQSMTEEGWAAVMVARREDVQDRLLAMDTPEREFDAETSKKLARIEARREKLEEAAEKLGTKDERKLSRLQRRHETLEAEEEVIINEAPEYFAEETKAVATAFLILDPDGRVHREYRVPRMRGDRSAPGDTRSGTKRAAPTSDELSDKQLAATFTHQALAVREALLNNDATRQRVLALILHETVRSDALSVRHEPNGTTVHAERKESFASPAFERLRERRSKLDLFAEKPPANDREAYQRLSELSKGKLDALVDLLVVNCITAHLQHRTDLVHFLAGELNVNVRDDWRPDAEWLSGYQKIQLAQLISDLQGPAHTPPPERKKSESVEALAKLFADAAEDKLEDKKLAERVNRWVPSNLRETTAACSE